jgi:hypothetical protein
MDQAPLLPNAFDSPIPAHWSVMSGNAFHMTAKRHFIQRDTLKSFTLQDVQSLAHYMSIEME